MLVTPGVEFYPPPFPPPPPNVERKKLDAAKKRAMVLGRAATEAQLDELAELLPVSLVQVDHLRHYPVPGRERRFKMLNGAECGALEKRLQAKLTPETKGGITNVRITSGSIVVYGDAACRTSENFNRVLGIRIAFGRALKELRAIADKPLGLSFAEKL